MMSLHGLYSQCFCQLFFSFKMQILASFAVTFLQEKVIPHLSRFPPFSVKNIPTKIQQTCLNPALKGKDLISYIVQPQKALLI